MSLVFSAVRAGESTYAFTATVVIPGNYTPFASAAITNLDRITEVLKMPLIGIITSMTSSTTSSLEQCSYFELDYTASSVRPIGVEHRYVESFANGMALWPSLGTIKSVQDGAIQVMGVDWKIQWPQLSYCLY